MKIEKKIFGKGGPQMAFISSDGDMHKCAPIPPIPPMAPMPPHSTAGHCFVFKTGQGNLAQSIHQSVDDGMLHILISMPGIDKSTLKVRSKSDKLSISAQLKEEYVDKLGDRENSYTVDLLEEVVADKANASYRDGVLSISFPLSQPGHNVDIDE